jgi:hypothetical protein
LVANIPAKLTAVMSALPQPHNDIVTPPHAERPTMKIMYANKFFFRNGGSEIMAGKREPLRLGRHRAEVDTVYDEVSGRGIRSTSA